MKYTIAAIIGAIALLLFANIQGAWSQELLPPNGPCVTSSQNQDYLFKTSKKNGGEIKLLREFTSDADIKALRELFADAADVPVESIIPFDRLEQYTSSFVDGSYLIVVYKDGCQVKEFLAPSLEWDGLLKDHALNLVESSG